MKLFRNELEDQGVMYSGKGFSLFPPEYLVMYGPPKGSVPVGAWEVTVIGYRPLLHHTSRFSSLEEALAYMREIAGEEVLLETTEERKQRQERR